MLFFPSHLFKIRKLLVLLLYILLSLFLLSLNSNLQGSIKNKVIFILSPLQRTSAKIDKNLAAFKKEDFNLEMLREQNQRLSEKLSELQAERHIWQEVIRENKRLRKLVNFEKKGALKLIPAQVIGRDATNWNKIIFINKGSADGLIRNLPVISPKGLVGQIIELTPRQSKVITILDTNSRVAALVERNRAQGVVCGTNEVWCQFNYISLREEITEGDGIISSGQGGIFPKGLIIGKVESAKKIETELFQRIKIHPAVNFSQLEEVMVIPGKK